MRFRGQLMRFRKTAKLTIRVINFELVQPMCPRYSNVTGGRTDGQTDRRTTYDSNTALALRASCGKKGKIGKERKSKGMFECHCEILHTLIKS